MARMCASFLLVIFAACCVRAASPDPASLVVAPEDVATARVWIAKLNSQQFRERERAMEQLSALGRKALGPLTEALMNPDPEIAERVRELQPLAATADLEARIETFLADADERFVHELPGWSRFRAGGGPDPTVRELFTEIVRDRENYELLASLSTATVSRPAAAALIGGTVFAEAEEPPRDRILQALANRRQMVQLRINPIGVRPVGFVSKPPTLPTMALVILAETTAPEQMLIFNGGQFSTTSFFYQQAAREAFAGTGKYAPVFRTLVARWLDTRQGAAALSNAMNTSFNNKFETDLTLRIAGRLTSLPGGFPTARANGLGMIGRLKGTAMLPVVLDCLKDDRLLAAFGAPPNLNNVEVRDFALLIALYLTGQTPSDYGYLALPNANDNNKFTYLAAQFQIIADGPKQDERRRLALEKWTTWETTTWGAAAGAIGPIGLLHAPNGRLGPKPVNALPLPVGP